jgi:hypothetical protein
MKTFTEAYKVSMRKGWPTILIWLGIWGFISLFIPAGIVEKVVFSLVMTAGVVAFTIQMQRYKRD